MLERAQSFINDAMVKDKNEFVVADLVMDIYDEVVECDTTTVAITVTLPNVAEAKGKIYTIVLVVDGGNNVTIQDNDESKGWPGDFTLADAADAYVLYSNGRQWFTLATIGI